jgi:hypothetical protein
MVIDGAGETLGDKATRYFGSAMALVGPTQRATTEAV